MIRQRLTNRIRWRLSADHEREARTGDVMHEGVDDQAHYEAVECKTYTRAASGNAPDCKLGRWVTSLKPGLTLAHTLHSAIGYLTPEQAEKKES